jgi:hypothetical protein
VTIFYIDATPTALNFSGMTVCGEGELVKTFLQPGQIATGEELK